MVINSEIKHLVHLLLTSTNNNIIFICAAIVKQKERKMWKQEDAKIYQQNGKTLRA